MGSEELEKQDLPLSQSIQTGNNCPSNESIVENNSMQMVNCEQEQIASNAIACTIRTNANTRVVVPNTFSEVALPSKQIRSSSNAKKVYDNTKKALINQMKNEPIFKNDKDLEHLLNDLTVKEQEIYGVKKTLAHHNIIANGTDSNNSVANSFNYNNAVKKEIEIINTNSFSNNAKDEKSDAISHYSTAVTKPSRTESEHLEDRLCESLQYVLGSDYEPLFTIVRDQFHSWNRLLKYCAVYINDHQYSVLENQLVNSYQFGKVDAGLLVGALVTVHKDMELEQTDVARSSRDAAKWERMGRERSDRIIKEASKSDPSYQ